MTTITDFLLARIAEDEAVARETQAWLNPSTTLRGWMGDGTDELDGFVERFTPARVLAECEAKRRVIEYSWGDHLSIEGEWGSGRSREEMDAKDDVPDAVRALAEVDADHPDYREAWRA